MRKNKEEVNSKHSKLRKGNPSSFTYFDCGNRYVCQREKWTRELDSD